jgi:hypothetical protein
VPLVAPVVPVSVKVMSPSSNSTAALKVSVIFEEAAVLDGPSATAV